MNTKKIIGTLLKTILPLAFGLYLFWYFFTSMTPESKDYFYRAIREANYFWVILAMILGVVAYLSRAFRWKYVLEPLGYETKFWHRYHAVMIGYLINLTIPRAGEASRSAMLYRSDGVPFSTSFGTIIAERAVDFVVLSSIALLTAFIGFDDFMEIKRQIEVRFSGTDQVQQSGFQWKYIVYGVMALGALVLAYLVLFKKSFRDKFINFAKEVMAGLFSIFRSQFPFSYLIHTAVIWVCYLAMFALPFQSLEATSQLDSGAILLGFIAGSLGITFTNGGIGTYPLLVGLVVAFYIGEDHPEGQAVGNALGMLIWTSQTILMIILGLISMAMLPKNYSKEEENEPADLSAE